MLIIIEERPQQINFKTAKRRVSLFLLIKEGALNP
jgi:hypothetical protein